MWQRGRLVRQCGGKTRLIVTSRPRFKFHSCHVMTFSKKCRITVRLSKVKRSMEVMQRMRTACLFLRTKGGKHLSMTGYTGYQSEKTHNHSDRSNNFCRHLLKNHGIGGKNWDLGLQPYFFQDDHCFLNPTTSNLCSHLSQPGGIWTTPSKHIQGGCSFQFERWGQLTGLVWPDNILIFPWPISGLKSKPQSFFGLFHRWRKFSERLDW